MAIAARQRGLHVAVADSRRPPIDKACGEGLMPDGLEALERLGLQLPLAEAYPFRGIRFLSRELSTDALFPASGFGLAARRTVLHRVMTERAAQVGTELLWGAAVTGIGADGVHVGKDVVRARWIIGADGSNSRVRRWAGLAGCIEAGDVSPYQKVHDRLAVRPLLMARLMLTLNGRPRLQHRTLQVFRPRPELFRRLLALHVGALPPRDLVWDGLTLGWGLISA